ncbi:MAG: von Willebrand factor type A domain-containing protein [Bacteroidetes bacterium]|nr:von Willebrand factor type A domain-containing protein [Bacteroidota bacterium]
MKKAFLAALFILFIGSAVGQYYLRGEIKNERGTLLEGVLIQLNSKGLNPFYSGNSGAFGIPSNQIYDTITLQLNGYEILKASIDTRKMQSFVLQMLPSTANQFKKKLNSITKNLNKTSNSFMNLGESYSSHVENEFIDAKQFPETGLALNIDHASYSNIRRFINNQMPVPTDAVRIEEMLNYFNLNKDSSNNARPFFSCNTALTTCPWNEHSQLFFTSIAAPKLNLDSIAPSNLVFLIDISGSMDKPNRLPLLQAAFKLLVENLREKDTVSLVTYGGGVDIRLYGVSGKEKTKINQAIDSLEAGGDTPGTDAIRIAYATAKRFFMRKGNNRVIIATDGDFNVGEVSEKAMEDLIGTYRLSGIYLTCLGVGMGNYKDSKLELLSKKGNGNFAYLDNLQEAEKVLVTELTQTIYSVANDAYLSINFNPTRVSTYRLIGFDNKKDALSDSTTQMEGGEVGTGHHMLAVFEITPTKQDSISEISSTLASIQINYKIPQTQQLIKQVFEAKNQVIDINTANSNYQFGTAVCMFGTLLKNSKFKSKINYDQILQLASSSYQPTDKFQKEFLVLVEKSKQLNAPSKKKKNALNN